MSKKNLKAFILLLIAMFISEILNGIIYYGFYIFVDWSVSDNFIEIICRIIVAIFALLSYLFIGKKIFSKIDGEKAKRKIVIILTVIIAISYPVSAQFSISYGLFYDVYWSMCSPITYLLLLPFLLIEHAMPILYGILFTVFSPISVILIWLFSLIRKA